MLYPIHVVLSSLKTKEPFIVSELPKLLSISKLSLYQLLFRLNAPLCRLREFPFLSVPVLEQWGTTKKCVTLPAAAARSTDDASPQIVGPGATHISSLTGQRVFSFLLFS